MGVLDGKVVVVTGGANGIGAAISRKAVNAGGRVVIADLQEDKAQHLVQQLPEGCAVFSRCDVRHESEVAAAVDTAIRQYGRLDVMVNNAGILGQYGRYDQADVEGFLATYAVNVGGVVAGIKAAACAMMKQGGGGDIINIASCGGIVGWPNMHAYSSSKAAVISITKTASNELWPNGIRVNAISPIWVDTPMVRSWLLGDPNSTQELSSVHLEMAPGLKMPLISEHLKVDEVADAVLLLLSPSAKPMNGHNLVLDCGMLSRQPLKVGMRPTAAFVGSEYRTGIAGEGEVFTGILGDATDV